MAGAFFVSATDQPHPGRTRAILAAHPEIRGLMGRNPWTAGIMTGLVALQTGIAAIMGVLGGDYWWLSLVLAYGVGAFASHCLYVVIHDSVHKLVFRGRTANAIVAMIGDLPNVIPGALGFGICHLAHHARQGDYDTDADIATEWEARLIGNRWYAKALWLLLFPLFQITRPARLKGIRVVTRWTAANLVACLIYDAIIVYAFGWNAILYLGASMLFSIGLHPLGGRWIQEHFTLDPAQETRSYYGPLNLVAMNVGYHNEHHDFPAVPWNRLPRIRAMAPEFYDILEWVPSWTRLWFQFLSDPRYSLHSRVLRPKAAP